MTVYISGEGLEAGSGVGNGTGLRTNVNKITTTDEIPTVIADIAANPVSTYYVEAIITVYAGAGLVTRAAWKIAAGFFRATGSTLSQISTTVSLVDRQTGGPMSVAFAVNSGTQKIEIKVTGASETTADWKCALSWLEVTD